MVLEDTIRVLKIRMVGREICKVPQMGRFRTIKLACTIGTSESFSLVDGVEFFMWISDDLAPRAEISARLPCKMM